MILMFLSASMTRYVAAGGEFFRIKSAAWNRTIPEERAHGAADEIHTLT